MTDILDDIKVRAERLTYLGGETQDLALDTLALIERLREAEAERDDMRERAQKAREVHLEAVERLLHMGARVERAEATIKEALAATKQGNILTPPWVIAILSRYENGTNPEPGRTDDAS